LTVHSPGSKKDDLIHPSRHHESSGKEAAGRHFSETQRLFTLFALSTRSWA
jgi:hypothetical protein